MELRGVIQRHPNAAIIPAVATSAVFGLTLTPTLLPVVLTLSLLLFYGPILFHRPHPRRYSFLVWLSIASGSCLARVVPALTALAGTSGTSVAVLFSMSLAASTVAMSAIFADIHISARTQTPQVVLFPAIWTTVWAIISHLPFNLGRLTSWSPMYGTQAYQWMAPWTGPAGIDWITAAWAVVVSQGVGIWYMGNTDDEELSTATSTSRKSSRRTAGTWVLATVLIALTVPSFLISDSPLPVAPSETVSALTVGCVLPSKFKGVSPTIEEYLDESVILRSRSAGPKLLLWPEGAVHFSSAEERDSGFQLIQGKLGDEHTYLGVSFHEDVSTDVRHSSVSHNGIAIISPSGVHLTYHKRHLVPIAESHRLTPGIIPPGIVPIRLQDSSQRQKWKRDVNITASICLDFAMPSPFRNLDYRPAVILAPARTWDPVIANRMWEEVKQRANEVGSLALWCDGGQDGFSGIAGQGYNDVYQVGEGSWTRSVGIPHPFDSSRTFYMRAGDWTVVGASWAFVLGPIALLMLAPGLHNIVLKLRDRAAASRRILFASPNDLQDLTTGQPPLLPSSSLYGPVSSTRSNLPSAVVREPLASSSLGSFHLITSADLPIRLDDSPKCKKAPSLKHFSPATPHPLTSRSLRIRFIGSFARRVRSLAKLFRRRNTPKHPTADGLESLKVDNLSVLQSTSLRPGIHQRVNTWELAASASSSLFEAEPTPSTHSSESSVPPSPSWLSRNVDSTDQDISETPNSSIGVVESPDLAKSYFSNSKENQSPDQDPPFVSSETDAKRSLVSPINSIHRPIFVSLEQDTLDIPDDIKTDLNSPDMDFTGKQAAEVVDFGGEVDYSDFRWFQDPPPKQPPAPQSASTPYVPLPGVIEQNEAFEFALGAAPNVLYARYKQYGQLGVLAWCSEFGELIDNLKDLGFKGNMFVATRTQALRTCEELLKLTKHSLDLKMQIIIMYLSSQVARLRRFLDGEKVWDDYPEPHFPDYKKYSAGEF
ncbi:hypothetical protein R3P38DRAFT_3339422 [Favolaschia claudopus]|uniref:CN hydrolase domain-containing protein n=1 Tax=Favolaschia claudopus TaxID=2862362 RepID=A0AAW0EH69_9AGAR